MLAALPALTVLQAALLGSGRAAVARQTSTWQPACERKATVTVVPCSLYATMWPLSESDLVPAGSGWQT